jgi:adenosylhomocysteinase
VKLAVRLIEALIPSPQAALVSRPFEGRLLNLGNANGHLRFVMAKSFTNQRRPRLSCGPSQVNRRTRSTCCPGTWTRRSRLHLDAPGVWLTELTKTQAGYLDVAGPYKADQNRD